MYSDVYSGMYRVMYKGYSGGYTISDEMTYGAAFEFREECLLNGYPKENVYIVYVVE